MEIAIINIYVLIKNSSNSFICVIIVSINFNLIQLKFKALNICQQNVSTFFAIEIRNIFIKLLYKWKTYKIKMSWHKSATLMFN